MRLLAVYGLKTADYGFLERFYPTRRLTEECDNRGLTLRFLFPPDVPSFLAEESVPPGETLCLIRGRVDIDTVRMLERRGYFCVNSSSSIALANDKLETARFLRSLGYPTPVTALAPDREAVFAEADYPLVAKPRRGSRGEGILLVRTPLEASSLGEEWIRDGKEYLFQEFITSSAGKDLRVFFAADSILAVAERQSRGDSFISNACTGGTMTVPDYGTDLAEPWRSMVRDIARKSGLRYGTVDFLYALGGESLTVCELNAAPGFEALERDTGCNIAGALLDALITDFNKATRS